MKNVGNINELIEAFNCLKEFIEDRKNNSDLKIYLFYKLFQARIKDKYIENNSNLFFPNIFTSIYKSDLKIVSSQMKLKYPNSKELIRNIFNVNEEIMEENKNELYGINIISPIKEELIEEDNNAQEYDELLYRYNIITSKYKILENM